MQKLECVLDPEKLLTQAVTDGKPTEPVISVLYYRQYKRYFHLEIHLKAAVTCEFLFLPMVERISHFSAWSFFPLCWGKSRMILVKPVWSTEANGEDGAPCMSWSERPWLWPGHSAYTCQHYTEEPSAYLERGNSGAYIQKEIHLWKLEIQANLSQWC